MRVKKSVILAFLVAAGIVLQLLESFVGKNVIVKGMTQYVNKEPYLLIFVEDVCEL